MSIRLSFLYFSCYMLVQIILNIIFFRYIYTLIQITGICVDSIHEIKTLLCGSKKENTIKPEEDFQCKKDSKP